MSIRNGSSTIDAFTRTPDGQPIDQRMKDKTTGTINRYYYLTDGLGSVVALVDQAGSTTPVSTYKYDPYGNDAGSTRSITSRFRFAGGYLSTSLGLYKFGERWYDPSTGRWLQQDLLEDPLAQKGWNRYDYAGDDPANFTDADGMLRCRTFFGKSECKVMKKGKKLVKKAKNYAARHKTAIAIASATAAAAGACWRLGRLAALAGAPFGPEGAALTGAVGCALAARASLGLRQYYGTILPPQPHSFP